MRKVIGKRGFVIMVMRFTHPLKSWQVNGVSGNLGRLGQQRAAAVAACLRRLGKANSACAAGRPLARLDDKAASM